MVQHKTTKPDGWSQSIVHFTRAQEDFGTIRVFGGAATLLIIATSIIALIEIWAVESNQVVIYTLAGGFAVAFVALLIAMLFSIRVDHHFRKFRSAIDHMLDNQTSHDPR